MNPQTIVYLEEGASIQMDTVQIRGVDSTKRYTKIVCGKGAEAVITERLLTHGRQVADSGHGHRAGTVRTPGRVISRSVAQDESSQVFRPCVVGNAKCFGHVQCDSIIMGQAKISSVPEIAANDTEAQLIHEAAIGKTPGISCWSWRHWVFPRRKRRRPSSRLSGINESYIFAAILPFVIIFLIKLPLLPMQEGELSLTGQIP